MYARVTLLEIDTVRVALDTALELFETQVLPELRTRPGYQGVYVMTTPEGKAALVSFWETPEEAETNAGGWYAQTLGEFGTLFRAPPGRERYEVQLADLPVPVRT